MRPKGQACWAIQVAGVLFLFLFGRGVADAQTIEILAAPRYVAGDGSATGGTPCALLVSVTGASANATYYIKAYTTAVPSGARTWNPGTLQWVGAGSAWSAQRTIQTDAEGKWRGWLQSYFYTSAIGQGRTLRVRLSDGSSAWDGDVSGVTVMDMGSSGDGAWVHGTAVTATAGQVIVALDASGNILGSYVVEDNGIAEAPSPYPSVPGYFRFAVPANASIARLEIRNSANEVVYQQAGSWHAGAAGTDTDLDAQEDVSLPVLLVSFEARRTPEGVVEVRWQTASEVEIVGFHVCRSVEGLPGPGDSVSGLIRTQGQEATGASYVWCDAQVPVAEQVWYALYAVEHDGSVRLLASTVVFPLSTGRGRELPQDFQCVPPFPNPFGEGVGASATCLRWWGDARNSSPVRLAIFDPRGRLVRYEILPYTGVWFWDGCDGSGNRLPGGVYLMRVNAGGQSGIFRVSLVR
ncbi:MAG: hypothetical protein ONB23_09925 [candidate division KSB1 bacterium]|nr:hypothetical protein [candidate division KSB1 bacterium]